MKKVNNTDKMDRQANLQYNYFIIQSTD